LPDQKKKDHPRAPHDRKRLWLGVASDREAARVRVEALARALPTWAGPSAQDRHEDRQHNPASLTRFSSPRSPQDGDRLGSGVPRLTPGVPAREGSLERGGGLASSARLPLASLVRSPGRGDGLASGAWAGPKHNAGLLRFLFAEFNCCSF
jgi:hypothetical protein